MLTGLITAACMMTLQEAASKTPSLNVTAEPEPGQLCIVDRKGRPGDLMPLKGTKVNAEISGFSARVTLVQTFTNPSKDPVEAIYTFPLPADAAVDRMRMKIGDRIVNGQIMRSEEARMVYEEAKAQGKGASLLDQERPNIFTQSVANIMPGADVEIEISYVQLIKYEEGEFEFNFPMVVGPRYLGASTPDPDKIAPPITPKGTRTGANIELNLMIDAGAPILDVRSVLHEIQILKPLTETQQNPIKMGIALAKKDEIPNRDFILRWRCGTNTVQSAFLTHADPEKGGFFTLILLPPKSPTQEQISPREVIFVMDQSGSQSGFPIEKSKELTLKLIETLRPGDTFNVISFANNVNSLWSSPKENTPKNLQEARKYIQKLDANGGTQLLSAVLAALTPKPDAKRLRLVVFNTDGFVGNDFEILNAIQKHRAHSRMFTFGIGSGVNRFLIDSMSLEGKGDSEIVTLEESADGALKRFLRRTQTPVLTDIQVHFEGVQIQEAFPSVIPDVFSEKPVVIKGRYTQPGQGFLVISGKLGGKPWSERVPITLPATDQDGSSIATLWAREKVDELMRSDWLTAIQPGTHNRPVANTQEQVVQVALQYGIMTQWTSFVAVEERIVNLGGKQRTVQVPVEMTEGVSYEGIFGKGKEFERRRPRSFATSKATQSPAMRTATKAPSEKYDDGILDPQVLKDMDPKQRRKLLYESKVPEKLRKTKGQVEVQIMLKEFKPEHVKKLKELGFKLEFEDKNLKVVFGTCDAKVLEELAQLEFVNKISPL